MNLNIDPNDNQMKVVATHPRGANAMSQRSTIIAALVALSLVGLSEARAGAGSAAVNIRGAINAPIHAGQLRFSGASMPKAVRSQHHHDEFTNMIKGTTARPPDALAKPKSTILKAKIKSPRSKKGGSDSKINAIRNVRS